MGGAKVERIKWERRGSYGVHWGHWAIRGGLSSRDLGLPILQLSGSVASMKVSDVCHRKTSSLKQLRIYGHI